MWCSKNRATISIHSCIRRQELIEEYQNQNGGKHLLDSEIGGESIFKDLNISKLKKCFNCKRGLLIRENPDRKLDKDIRSMIYEYLEKPKKQKLQFIKYSLKVKNEKLKRKIRIRRIF